MENTPSELDAAIHEVTKGLDLVTKLRSLLRLAPLDDPVVKLADGHFVEISNSMKSALCALSTSKSLQKEESSAGGSAKSIRENPNRRSHYICSFGKQVCQAKKQVQRKDSISPLVGSINPNPKVTERFESVEGEINLRTHLNILANYLMKDDDDDAAAAALQLKGATEFDRF